MPTELSGQEARQGRTTRARYVLAISLALAIVALAVVVVVFVS